MEMDSLIFLLFSVGEENCFVFLRFFVVPGGGGSGGVVVVVVAVIVALGFSTISTVAPFSRFVFTLLIVCSSLPSFSSFSTACC